MYRDDVSFGTTAHISVRLPDHIIKNIARQTQIFHAMFKAKEMQEFVIPTA